MIMLAVRVRFLWRLQMAGMTRRQQLFADEYLVDLNAEQAAIRAGYSPRFARGNAHKLVAYSCIRDYLDKRMAEKDAKLVAKQDEVLKYLTAVMRGETESEIVVIEGCGDGCSNAIKMSKTPDETQRLKAAELLGKAHGIFRNESANVSVTVPVILKDDVHD